MMISRCAVVVALLVTALAPAAAHAQTDGVIPTSSSGVTGAPVGWLPPGAPVAPAPERTPCGDRMCPAGTACVGDGCETFDGRVVETEALDPEHERRHRLHERLMIGGGLTLAVGWLAELVFSSFAGYHLADPYPYGREAGFEPGWDDFRFAGIVPLAGPWIQLAMARGDLTWTLYSALFGVAQIVGLALLVVAVVIDVNDRPSAPTVAVAPMLADGVAASSSAAASEAPQRVTPPSSSAQRSGKPR